jgi:hypothetical protein
MLTVLLPGARLAVDPTFGVTVIATQRCSVGFAKLLTTA